MKYLKKIKTEAAKRNIPLKQLADRLNISEDVLKSALNNDALSIHQLNTICDELSMHVGDVFAMDNSIKMKMEPRRLHFLNNKAFC